MACLLAVYILWGTTYYAIKVAISGFATFFFVGTRFLAAGGLILLWQLLRGAPMPTWPQWLMSKNSAICPYLFLFATR